MTCFICIKEAYKKFTFHTGVSHEYCALHAGVVQAIVELTQEGDVKMKVIRDE